MAAQHTVHSLSPQLTLESAPELAPKLSSVLSSLSVSLDAELNRYRRNRRLDSFGRSLVRDDIFADVESDPAFDIEPVETALVLPPPPVPPNKKLIASQAALANRPFPSDQSLSGQPSLSNQSSHCEPLALDLTADLAALDLPASKLPASNHLGLNLPALPASAQSDPNEPVGGQPDVASDTTISALLGLVAETRETHGAIAPLIQSSTPDSSPDGSSPDSYLSSSKQLIKTLEDQSGSNVSEPTVCLPERKTVSLVAGATVAFLGLVGGLGASYFMSDPIVAQRLANGLQDGSKEITVPRKAFDPPGPDLSGAEFIELEIDNLSSLQMPQSAPVDLGALDPGALPPTPAIPNAAVPAPAIQQPQANAPNTVAPVGSRMASSQATGSQGAGTQSLSRRAVGSQSVMLPVGLTYYVTVPFTSERGLRQIRQSISEAFVRRFSDGNRIQVAAFDNAQSAQQFIEELKAKNISAELYGPTTE